MRVRFAALLLAVFALAAGARAASVDDKSLFYDSHFHLTNYIQKGPTAHAYVAMMGDRIGRSTLFGIPLQQTWDYANSGNFAPTYYLQSDAPLYYYSFTDAVIATQYLSLPPNERKRLDPMITGFNPADMYGVDHIRRVLQTYPGVFEGIGEFTIHKEFVSSKVAGNIASLANPALDKIFDFAAEAGLVVLIHCDIDTPFDTPGADPVYLTQMRALLKRHPDTTVIWAHTGLGRVVRPPVSQASFIPVRNKNHIQILEEMLEDPSLRHLYFDISWDEVAKYAVASPDVEKRLANLINKYHERFLFGTDVVAPKDQNAQLRVFHLWDPVFAKLTPQTSEDVRKANYQRLFDEARIRVRAWEKANPALQ
jgi:predicted TIM-barrel fold metal-dependent hydrolase